MNRDLSMYVLSKLGYFMLFSNKDGLTQFFSDKMGMFPGTAPPGGLSAETCPAQHTRRRWWADRIEIKRCFKGRCVS